METTRQRNHQVLPQFMGEIAVGWVVALHSELCTGLQKPTRSSRYHQIPWFTLVYHPKDGTYGTYGRKKGGTKLSLSSMECGVRNAKDGKSGVLRFDECLSCEGFGGTFPLKLWEMAIDTLGKWL